MAWALKSVLESSRVLAVDHVGVSSNSRARREMSPRFPGGVATTTNLALATVQLSVTFVLSFG